MEQRARLRERGLGVGRFGAGPRNAIVDVRGVRVGHHTVVDEAAGVRTGVTAVLPHGGDLFGARVLAGAHVINGYGKAAGLSQIEEMGTLESPVLITNTFSVGAAWTGGLAWLRERTSAAGTVNVVVFECDDAPLNGRQTTPEDAVAALEAAREDEARAGCVGAGAGMSCLGFKSGVGLSSRVNEAGHVLGCLVVTNYGSANQLCGAGPEGSAAEELGGAGLAGSAAEPSGPDADGSVVMVLATDAPLSERQLRRLAGRAGFGLARARSFGSSGSGDYALAFSTAHRIPHFADEPDADFRFLRDDSRPFRELLEMAVEAVHEAILDSLAAAHPVPGRDAMPAERLAALLYP